MKNKICPICDKEFESYNDEIEKKEEQEICPSCYG
jgi:hypothetical protein